jgi:hypothetical protein
MENERYPGKNVVTELIGYRMDNQASVTSRSRNSHTEQLYGSPSLLSDE